MDKHALEAVAAAHSQAHQRCKRDASEVERLSLRLDDARASLAANQECAQALAATLKAAGGYKRIDLRNGSGVYDTDVGGFVPLHEAVSLDEMRRD